MKRILLCSMIIVLLLGIDINSNGNKVYAQDGTLTQTYGFLNIPGWSSYNMGLNLEMTGGTAGTIYQDETLVILDKAINSKNVEIAYVYVPRLCTYGYVSSRYIVNYTSSDAILDLTSTSWTGYNMGVNPEVGYCASAGSIQPFEFLRVLNVVTNNHGYKVAYVYVPRIDKYGYIRYTYVASILDYAYSTVAPNSCYVPATRNEPIYILGYETQSSGTMVRVYWKSAQYIGYLYPSVISYYPPFTE